MVKMARLNFFLVSPDIHAKLVMTKTRNDHPFVSLEIERTEITHGKPFRKFYSSLLADPEYVNLVKKVIKEVSKQFGEHHLCETVLEMIKLKVKGSLFLIVPERKKNNSKQKKIEKGY